MLVSQVSSRYLAEHIRDNLKLLRFNPAVLGISICHIPGQLEYKMVSKNTIEYASRSPDIINVYIRRTIQDHMRRKHTNTIRIEFRSIDTLDHVDARLDTAMLELFGYI